MNKICFTLPTINQVTFTLTAEQDLLPIRGNAVASGDETFDQQVEDEIIARLDSGDIWGWASVCVTAEWKGYTGTDYLGGCSDKNAEDFMANSGYYEDMKQTAYNELIEKLKALAD